MLKKYDELTFWEAKKVSVMYSDQSTLEQYLYNFDEHGNYHGRQYAPPVGNIVNEPVKDISYQELHDKPVNDDEPDFTYPDEPKSIKKVVKRKSTKK